MKVVIALFHVVFFSFGSIKLAAQKKVDIVKFDWYQKMRAIDNDTTYIINFWATWCLPCVQELPVFEKINSIHKNEKVKVILVSLDFYKKLPIVVIPYLEKKQYKSEVVLLDESDYNKWIDKVDKSWSGSIPATVIFNNQKKQYLFLEREITFEEINGIIKNINQ